MPPVRTLRHILLLHITVAFLVVACAGAQPPLRLDTWWDFDHAAPVHFITDNPDFAQEKEIEISGLCADDAAVYLLCENPADGNRLTILRVPVTGTNPYPATVLQYPFDGPADRQFEGMTLHNGMLYVAYEQGRSDETAMSGFLAQPLDGDEPPRDYTGMPDQWGVVTVGRGRNVWGFEGMAVGGGRLYIMDERDRLPPGKPWAERRDRTLLYAVPDPDGRPLPATPELRLKLEPPGQPGLRDQRLSDILYTELSGQPVILATGSYNQDRQWHYELRAYNADTGALLARHILPIPDWARQGDPDGEKHATNLEGLTLGPDGDLWLVTDNGFHTWDGNTLLVRVPRRNAP